MSSYLYLKIRKSFQLLGRKTAWTINRVVGNEWRSRNWTLDAFRFLKMNKDSMSCTHSNRSRGGRALSVEGIWNLEGSVFVISRGAKFDRTERIRSEFFSRPRRTHRGHLFVYLGNRSIRDTRYLPCTKETKGHTALILFPSERARNSEWETNFVRVIEVDIWDTLLVYGLSMVHQIGRSPCRHNSPLEQARFDSQGNIESAFEALINSMNTRSLACEKMFRFSRTSPWGWIG